MAETPNPKALQAVRYSRLALGIPYAWGGTNYSVGVDCSGLIYTAYNLGAGVTLPRTSQAMYAEPGFRPVKVAQAIPGDLVFGDMGTDGPGHVVLAIGDGKCIAAEHTGTRVQIMDIPSAFGAGLMLQTAKRPLPAVGEGAYSGGQVITASGSGGGGSGSSFLGGLTSGFSALTDPHTYYRAGQVILGALFVFIGIFMMAAGNSNVQSAAKGVAQVAMVAE